jgi:hypothetical protein
VGAEEQTRINFVEPRRWRRIADGHSHRDRSPRPSFGFAPRNLMTKANAPSDALFRFNHADHCAQSQILQISRAVM